MPTLLAMHFAAITSMTAWEVMVVVILGIWEVEKLCHLGLENVQLRIKQALRAHARPQQEKRQLNELRELQRGRRLPQEHCGRIQDTVVKAASKNDDDEKRPAKQNPSRDHGRSSRYYNKTARIGGPSCWRHARTKCGDRHTKKR